MELLTEEQLKSTGRPIGKMVGSQQLAAFIKEAERMLVKPVLGDALLIAIKGDDTHKYDTLLDGGVYTDKGGEQHSIAGLREAMSYYVYAQNIMVGDYQATRFGVVVKDNDYSQHLTDKNKSDAYNNALEVANEYMRECVTYCKSMGFISRHGHSRTAGSVRIRRIG